MGAGGQVGQPRRLTWQNPAERVVRSERSGMRLGSTGQESDLARSEKTDTLARDAQASIYIQKTILEAILTARKAGNKAGQIELLRLKGQGKLTAMGMARQGEINTKTGCRRKNVGTVRQ